MHLLAALAGFAIAAAAFPAGAQPAPGCFFVRDVGDRTVGGPHTLYFKVKDRSHMHAIAYFHVETKGDCDTGRAPTEHAAFTVSSTVTAAGTAQVICNVNELAIAAANYCPVASVQRMSRAEVAALPRRIQP
jgi:hypothetical protein